MDLKTKAKKLITQSILLAPVRRESLLNLVDSLNYTELMELIETLESESKNIRKFVEDNFAKDQNGALLKKFDEFVRSHKRGMREESEEVVKGKEESAEGRILEEISKS